MSERALGNLEQWGHLLERLEAWRRSGRLDRHQDEILWLLRYPDNWRLREAALEAMKDLQTPQVDLIRAACSIMMDERLYYQVRVLAAEALARALAAKASAGGAALSQAREVREQMHALLDAHQPPVMHQALRRILPTLE
jgi:hypothetical protein